MALKKEILVGIRMTEKFITKFIGSMAIPKNPFTQLNFEISAETEKQCTSVQKAKEMLKMLEEK